MPPILAHRRSLYSTATNQPPSTWEVISVVSGAVWFTYTIYSSASQIWQWIQRKIEVHNEKLAMKDEPIPLQAIPDNQKLHKRSKSRSHSKLKKRWEPFSSLVNSIYWIQRVVKWIYIQADNIPLRVQLGVDRNYTAIQDAEWQVKNEQAEENVKNFAAKEFAKFYKKKHLDPYEEGSELYKENAALLQEIQKGHSAAQGRTHIRSRKRDFEIVD